jgi:hypothetical protein
MIWFDDERCFHGGTEEMSRYISALEERKTQYGDSVDLKLKEKHYDVIQNLKQKGFHIIPNVFSEETLDTIRAEMSQKLQRGEDLWKGITLPEEFLKSVVPFVSIEQPLFNCPSVKEIIFHDLLEEIATVYLNCKPAVGTFNLRKSFINTLPDQETQLYHCDKNSIKLMKFFVYLNDVGPYGGPLTIVEGSHRLKPEIWESKYRWTDKEVEEMYPGMVRHIEAKAGDLIIGITTGFHKGLKPIANERSMLTVNYTVHPENWKPITFKMRQADYLDLPEKKKPLTDFLRKE